MPDNLKAAEQQETVGQLVSYWLDPEDRIVKVNQLWDQFARANEGGSQLLASEIQGRRVFDFIIGDQTRMYLEALLQQARFLNRVISRSYRCDSPTVKRFMSMCIRPVEDSLAQLDHTLLKCEPLVQPLVYRHEPDPLATPLPRCSVCARLLIKGAWLLPEVAEIPGLLIPGKPLPVTYRVCPFCKRGQPRLQKTAARIL